MSEQLVWRFDVVGPEVDHDAVSQLLRAGQRHDLRFEVVESHPGQLSIRGRVSAFRLSSASKRALKVTEAAVNAIVEDDWAPTGLDLTQVPGGEWWDS